MDSQSQQYSLQIFGRDENGVQEEIGTVTAPEIGMNWVDTQGAAQELLNIQNEFLWIEMLWQINCRSSWPRCLLYRRKI